MRCHSVRERLSEYVSGSLKPGDRRAVEDHLGRCEACRKELESLKALDARLRQGIPALWREVKPSPAFEARLKQAIPAPPERPSRMADRLVGLWQNHRQVLAGGIAACLILALAISLPLVLTGKGVQPDMIAQESGQRGAPSISTPEADEYALKMAAPSLSESTPPVTPVPTPTPTPPPMPTANQDMLSGTYGFVAGESAAVPDEGLTFSEEMAVAKERELALWIALSDMRVKESFKGKTLVAIEVEGPEMVGDFACPGPTVVLTLRNGDGMETNLYICVDLDIHSVREILVPSE